MDELSKDSLKFYEFDGRIMNLLKLTGFLEVPYLTESLNYFALGDRALKALILIFMNYNKT